MRRCITISRHILRMPDRIREISCPYVLDHSKWCGSFRQTVTFVRIRYAQYVNVFATCQRLICLLTSSSGSDKHARPVRCTEIYSAPSEDLRSKGRRRWSRLDNSLSMPWTEFLGEDIIMQITHKICKYVFEKRKYIRCLKKISHTQKYDNNRKNIIYIKYDKCFLYIYSFK